MIYHLPGCHSYNAVVIGNHPKDKVFMSEKKAIKQGYRKALNC